MGRQAGEEVEDTEAGLMPRYDYGCSVCGVFERNTSVSLRDTVLCECGETADRLPQYQSIQVQVPLAFSEANKRGYTQTGIEAQTIAAQPDSYKGRWV